MRKSLLYLILGVFVAVAAMVAIWLAAYRTPALRVDRVLAAYREDGQYDELTIHYPLAETLFPPEIAPPTFRWEDTNGASDAWIVAIELGDSRDWVGFPCFEMAWTAPDDWWEEIKRRSLERPVTVTILGVNRRAQRRILSAARTTIRTSEDEVGAPLFYREVHLPFSAAVADPAAHIRWRFGEISSRQRPPVVLEKLPVCGNCHSFSRDGATFGMDVDYANDKGSYAVGPVTEEVTLDHGKMITWSDYRRDDGEMTFGLLSQVSPCGRYVVSTVKDRSVFVAVDDLAFSQLFFPIKGILAVYDRQTGRFRALPGADDKRFVQSNPTWSPDGKYLVFARARAYELKSAPRPSSVLLAPEDCAEFLEEGKTFLFDLHRIPFNDGEGGEPEPLAGASHNGMSNYFPKYSPDGKWIVFCKAKSFMLLQPDSKLYIIPSEGGQPRRLRCNTGGMNSWHSWSPNGHWLVFSSKLRSPYTQLLLTHIDARGRSSPPVLLDRFTTANTAANIPEFVNATGGAIRKIREQFLDATYYARAGNHAFQFGELDAAERAYRTSLELDPNEPRTHNELGAVLVSKHRFEEAEAHFLKATKLDPNNGPAHGNLGRIRSRQGKYEQALPPLRVALRITPDDPDCHRMLAAVLAQLARLEEAQAHLDKAARLDVRDPEARHALDRADWHLQAGRLAEAADHYRRALKTEPDYLPALVGLASLLATAPSDDLRNGAEALECAKRACKLTRYNNTAALAALASAHAETGRFDDAVSVAEQALQSAREEKDERLAASVERALELYRQGKPARRAPEGR